MIAARGIIYQEYRKRARKCRPLGVFAVWRWVDGDILYEWNDAPGCWCMWKYEDLFGHWRRPQGVGDFSALSPDDPVTIIAPLPR